MAAKIIDGKAVANRIREFLKGDVIELREKRGIIPGLAVILVGDDPASRIYVRNKKRACDEIGINSRIITMKESVSQQDLIDEIHRLNEDMDVHGILVQLPLPSHIHEASIIEAIDPNKDVDGFHPITMGRLLTGQEGFKPCTPKGILTLIEETGTTIEGKHAVVIGRSNIVGKPLALMLLRENATVTLCHSRTRDIKKIASDADILIAATGRPGLIDGDYIKDGAIVIDVGTTKVGNKLVGDVAFEDVVKKAGFITPVPGGVGPMTITMLLQNTILAAKGNE